MVPPPRDRNGASSRRTPASTKQKDPELVDLGRRVRRHRRAAGITQRTLATRAGLHPATIGHVEQGTQNAGVINLVKIARGLGIAETDLLAGPPPDADATS